VAGGNGSPDNGQVLCERCNNVKSDTQENPAVHSAEPSNDNGATTGSSSGGN
jgi:hypothetical protein